MKIYFVAGIPGTGKTTFGNWLEKERGFRHIDMEDNFRRIQPLYSYWQAANAGRCSFDKFKTELTSFPESIVMTWGFPPHAIDLAKEIASTVASCWWFDGPREFARAKWLQREGHTCDKYFISQCSDIDERRAEIDRIFSPNIVSVFTEDGDFRSPEAIASQILSK